MEQMMNLKVNGREVAFAGKTLAELIDRFGLDRSGIVAERNGEVVHREDAGSTLLAEGDVIELVRLVGGG
jgi:sulfur carrier protein